MSNEDRRQHGLAVIAAYEHLPNVETRDDGAPLVQVVTDLLTDLRHAVEPDDFAKALRFSESTRAQGRGRPVRQLPEVKRKTSARSEPYRF